MKQKFVEQIKGNDPLVENPKNVMQGTVAGFPVYALQGIDGTAYWQIVFEAKQGDTAPAYSMDSFLSELKSGNKKITRTSYNGKRIEITLRGSGKAGEQVREIINRGTAYLMQNGYIPCCGCCGEEVSVRLSSINGKLDFLCDGCYENLCNGLETNKQQLKEKKGNVITGIVGALLGALLGGVLWVLIYQLGYIAGVAGLVAAVCALKGYEKFGGKINGVGIVISLVIVAVVLYFAHNVSVAIEIQKAYRDYIEVSFFDAYRSIPEFMAEIPELKSAFWKDMIVGYGLTAVASFATIRTMFQNSTGNYKTGRY